MVTHDPLCSVVSGCDTCGPYSDELCCECPIINRTREDERRLAVERVRAKKGKSPSTRLDWDTIVIAVLDGTKLRLSKKELNEQA